MGKNPQKNCMRLSNRAEQNIQGEKNKQGFSVKIYIIFILGACKYFLKQYKKNKSYFLNQKMSVFSSKYKKENLYSMAPKNEFKCLQNLFLGILSKVAHVIFSIHFYIRI